MIDVCLLAWCLGRSALPPQRVTFVHELPGRPTIERLFAYEVPWAVVGFVQQTEEHDAVFGGVLPLTIAITHRVTVEGGAVLASADVPHNGSHANFMVAAHVRLTNRLAATFWHWSNGNVTGSNPSVNAVGLSVRVRGG